MTLTGKAARWVAGASIVAATVAGGTVVATAAPHLGTQVTADCTITKRGSVYDIVANGSWNVRDYLVNRTRGVLRNWGGQNVQDTGIVAQSPSGIGTTTLFEMNGLNYRFASSLRNVEFYVYNGGKLKGKVEATCRRVGFS
jgi:hypothetical protein